MDVDVDALTSCGIGRTVNKLKKAESEDVQTLAKALVKKWKDLVAAQEPCVAGVLRGVFDCSTAWGPDAIDALCRA